MIQKEDLTHTQKRQSQGFRRKYEPLKWWGVLLFTGYILFSFSVLQPGSPLQVLFEGKNPIGAKHFYNDVYFGNDVSSDVKKLAVPFAPLFAPHTLLLYVGWVAIQMALVLSTLIWSVYAIFLLHTSVRRLLYVQADDTRDTDPVGKRALLTQVKVTTFQMAQPHIFVAGLFLMTLLIYLVLI